MFYNRPHVLIRKVVAFFGPIRYAEQLKLGCFLIFGTLNNVRSDCYIGKLWFISTRKIDLEKSPVMPLNNCAVFVDSLRWILFHGIKFVGG